MKEIYTLEALQRPRDYVDTEFLRMREINREKYGFGIIKEGRMHIWEKR